MKLHNLHVLLLIGSAFSSPISAGPQKSASLFLDVLQKARDDIRNETNSLLTYYQSRTPEEVHQLSTSQSLTPEVEATFNTLISALTAASSSFKAAPAVRASDSVGGPLSDVVFAITTILQDIVSDVVKAIVSTLKYFNSSAVLQGLAGALINGILDVLNIAGNVLKGVPGIEVILQFIGNIIKNLPF